MRRNTTLKLLAVLGAAVAGFVAQPAHAMVVYDANIAFLDNEKPDGTEANQFTDALGGKWSYGQASEAAGEDTFGTFSIVTNHTDAFGPPALPANAGIEGYFFPSSALIPAVLQNTTAAPVATNFGVTLEPSEILLHPDADNAGVLRFTVPTGADGVYAIAGNFEKKNGQGNGTVNRVLVNGVSIFNVTLTGADTENEAPGAFTLTNVNLVGGNTVDFAVFANGDDFGSDSTGFTATLTVVPEPASLSVLAMSGLGLLARRRRAC